MPTYGYQLVCNQDTLLGTAPGEQSTSLGRQSLPYTHSGSVGEEAHGGDEPSPPRGGTR